MKSITEEQFHTVWTEAVGIEGYNKKLFQNLLQKMVKQGTVENTTLKETIILRVTKEMKEDLCELAKQSKREFSDYMRLVIEDAINKKTKI